MRALQVIVLAPWEYLMQRKTRYLFHTFFWETKPRKFCIKKGLNKKSLLDMINKEFAANYSTDLNDFEQDITEEYCNNIGLYK